MFHSDLCDFSDAYIIFKGTITVYAKRGANRSIDTHNRKLVLRKCAPFTSCLSKVNNILLIMLKVYCNANVSFN